MELEQGAARRRDGDHHSYFGGRKRSAGGEDGAHQMFRPNCGVTRAAEGRDALLTVARPLAAG